jgi:putative chitinase
MSLKKSINEVKSAESTISMILGIAVVVIIGVLLFNYFRGFSQPKMQLSDLKESENKTEEEASKTSLPAKYTVVTGDNLWKISEKFYRSGYNWVDIVSENKIQNPGVVVVGQELTIPDVPPKLATVKSEPKMVLAAGSEAISGESYTVVRGDTLWNISVRAYQDGYQWPKIAKVNNITQPNIIHPGTILKIPR